MTDCSLKTAGAKTYYCDVELTLQVIGGKWKPIIRELSRWGQHYENWLGRSGLSRPKGRFPKNLRSEGRS
jgi:DNA-binding HxlR family transcriptional regulator